MADYDDDSVNFADDTVKFKGIADNSSTVDHKIDHNAYAAGDKIVMFGKHTVTNKTQIDKIDSVNQDDGATPFKSDVNHNLIQPQGGQIYLYDLENNFSKWDNKTKQLRCDQYRWVHKGTYTLKHETQSHKLEIKKKSSAIDVENETKGDDGFRRFEFYGVGSFYMIHYVGDHTIYKGFAHLNSKSPSSDLLHLFKIK
uniref:Uncharacterized protein n=1 Tax=Amphimedon queenslandica TaxID=400682 RepID=A0A1X7V0E4_AMPQE